jgi:hypothetical protein
MKLRIAGGAAAFVLGAGLVTMLRPWAEPASSAATKKQQSGFLLLPPAAPAGQQVLYGHIKSLLRKGNHFVLRFDPAWFTSGITASQAKFEDTGSHDVPNDNYVVEEGHRLLTFVVPTSAHVTVLTDGANGSRISVSELAQIVKGKNPNHRHLSEPKAGFWIRVSDKYPSAILSLDQQYQP